MDNIYIDGQVQAIRRLHKYILNRDLSELTIVELLETQSQTLLESHRDRNHAVLFHLACWSPDFIGKPSADIMRGSLTIEQARASMAREYGFDNWESVEASGRIHLDANFESAVENLVHGHLEGLQVQLQSNPHLVSQQSQLGHQATLLHYVGANGVETQRQVTPYNVVEIARCLLDAGADVNAKANIYGKSTVLSLVETSAHPANAGVTEQLVAVLKLYGAR